MAVIFRASKPSRIGHRPRIRNGLIDPEWLLRRGCLFYAPLVPPYNAGAVIHQGNFTPHRPLAPSTQTVDSDGTFRNEADSNNIRDAITDTLRVEGSGVLIEGAEANVIVQSEDFDTTWTKVQGVTVSTNTTVAPDGTTTADTITDDSSNFEHLLQDVTIANDSTWWSCSVYILKDSDEARFPEMQVLTQGGTTQLIFVQINTATGATSVRSSTGTVNHYVEDAGDYWRFTASVLNNSTGNTTLRSILFPARSTTLGGTAGSTTGSIIAWGFQAENASFSSSYIPTTTGAVTRAQDDLRYPLLGNVNTEEGTLFACVTTEWDGGNTDVPTTSQVIMDVSANSDNDRIFLRHLDANDDWNYLVVADGVTVADATTAGLPTTRGVPQTLATDWRRDNMGLHYNGVLSVARDTSAAAPEVATGGTIQIGAFATNQTSLWWGNICHALVFKTALPQSEIVLLDQAVRPWAISRVP